MRDRILLCGPAFAGKTQLYFKLIGGSGSTTVSSSSVNETEKEVQVKVPTRLLSQQATPAEGDSAFTSIGAKLVDVPGHYNFRKSVQIEASGAKAIVLLIDAKDKSKFGEAGEILYDILGDIDIISE